MFRQTCLRIVPIQLLWNVSKSSSFFSKSLRPKFKKNLKDIKACNNAQKLCGVLLKAKIAIEDPSLVSTSSWDSYERNTDIFIKQLVYILDKEKYEHIVLDMIRKELSRKKSFNFFGELDDSDRREKLEPLLDVGKLRRKTSNNNNANEYLKKLISGIESVIASCDENSPYSIYRKRFPREGLDLLQLCLRDATVKHAEKLLDTIYKVGRARLDFSEAEKKVIGALMVETIEPVSRCILLTDCRHTRLESSLLRKRSSLQFYKDFYAKFPAQNGSLLENFYKEEINKSIFILDRLIIDWCGIASTRISNNLRRQDEFDYDTDGTDIDENDISGIPESHTWWTQCFALLAELKRTALD